MNKPKVRDKITCKDCGSNFDYEWKRRHEISKHNGKAIRIQMTGAPRNPFEASVSRTVKKARLQNESEVEVDTALEKDKEDLAMYPEFVSQGRGGSEDAGIAHSSREVSFWLRL